MEPIEQPEPEGADPAKRGRGRPPGSKNKPKLTIEPIAQVVEPTPEPIVQVVEPIPEPPPPPAPPKAKRAPRAPPAAPAAPIAVVAEPDEPDVPIAPAPAPIAPAPVESRKRPRVARVAESTIAQTVPFTAPVPTLSPAEQYQIHMQTMTQLRLQERAARQNHFDRLVGLV